MEVRLWFAAVICLAGCSVLGLLVAHPPIGTLDAETITWRGHATLLAAMFTESGRTIPLVVLSAIGAVIFWSTKNSVAIPIAILISQTISQALIEGAKHIFQRTRPDQWLVTREIGYSYPSGHAATTMVFYAAWFLVVWQSPLPKSLKTALLIVLAVWIVGISWSRIALGAHYLTDVLGGILFGTAWLCIAVALMRHFNLESVNR